MKFTSSFIRGFTASVILFFPLVVCLTGIDKTASTDTQEVIPTTTETSTTITFPTTTTATNANVTSCITTTTTVAISTTIPDITLTTTVVASNTVTTTALEATTTTNYIEIESNISESCIKTEKQIEEINNGLPITESERILLCNLVAREYGADWVTIYDKACVVAVVMNRVNSPQFPNTIYEVLIQPNQFTGYLASEYYTNKVTDSCIEAVNYYFAHPNEFGNWLYFCGDGQRNYFS